MKKTIGATVIKNRTFRSRSISANQFTLATQALVLGVMVAVYASIDEFCESYQL